MIAGLGAPLSGWTYASAASTSWWRRRRLPGKVVGLFGIMGGTALIVLGVGAWRRGDSWRAVLERLFALAARVLGG